MPHGGSCIWSHLRIAARPLFRCLVWILVIGLLVPGAHAWVKWKPAAGGLVLGVFFVAAGFGAAVNGVMRTRWGHLLNISNLMGAVWAQMFQGAEERGNGAVFFRTIAGEELPVWCCWAALAALCGFCLYLLNKKVRGAEVVR